MQFSLSPFITELSAVCDQLSSTDWFEGSAGNVSLLLHKAEIEPWLANSATTAYQAFELSNSVAAIAGYFLLITASGVRIGQISRNPEAKLALIEIAGDGLSYRIVWGLSAGGRPSSELMAHLLGHASRMQITGKSRALLHCHPPYTVAMSFVLKADNREFSRLLWGWHAEGLAVFPEGVGVVELSLPGGNYLATQSANLLAEHRMVIWARHGVIVAGETLEMCITLIEVAEKILRIAQLASSCLPPDGHSLLSWSSLQLHWIADSQLESLAKHYKVQPKYRY